MFTRNVGRIFVVAIGLSIFCAGANAQQTVYKWVDEDGVVHFSDAPPDQSKLAETETISIPRSPPAPVTAQPAPKPPISSAAKVANQPQQRAQAAPANQQIDISNMSIADLDRRCEAARERKIAPLRAAEIAKCKENKRNDPAWCERFNADFGDAGRTISGTMRPRMFDDLPECVEALRERNRRGR